MKYDTIPSLKRGALDKIVIGPSDGITSCAIKANGVNNIANKNNNLFILKTF